MLPKLNEEAETNPIQRLLKIMQALRDPQTGCAWDVKQTYQSIVPYTLEEVYELVDVIERQDFAELPSELGDLLFQVIFYAQIAAEEGRFDFMDVAQTVGDKLVRRHPHVFADQQFDSEQARHQSWEAIKKQERQQKDKQQTSLMDDIPQSLPALMRAYKVQKRAASHGFDWQHIEQVFDKMHEEIDELKVAMQSGVEADIKDEMGDVLFTTVNLSRFLGLKAEDALRQANQKFEQRFRQLENMISQDGKSLENMQLDEMEAYWQLAKQQLAD